MASRFKKVSETEQIPVSINSALFKKASVQEDPYAKLLASAERRKIAIAKETVGYKEDSKGAEEKEWERLISAQTLDARKFMPTDDKMSNMRPEDTSLRGIRRAGYDTDNDATSYRPSPSDFTFNDPITAAIRGASLWQGDTDEVDSLLAEMGRNDDATFDSKAARNFKEARKNNWDEIAVQLREPQFSSARAHQILRASHESVVASRFGMLDNEAINEHEAQRLNMAKNRMEQRLAIKDKHVSSQERHAAWEKEARHSGPAPSMQDRRAEWADELARRAAGD